jgi:hypothetical protein
MPATTRVPMPVPTRVPMRVPMPVPKRVPTRVPISLAQCELGSKQRGRFCPEH